MRDLAALGPLLLNFSNIDSIESQIAELSVRNNERLAEEKKSQEEEAKRLAEEKRKEQERLAKEQRKIELEKVALNPGFKGLKLGLTRQEIVQLNVCDKPTLGYYLGVPGETPLIDGQSCYKRKGWTFSFYFADDRLSELKINLGVYTREYAQEIHELLEDKYPVYYEPNKREKQLFFVGKSDKTDWVYRNGEVVLSARYACKQEDAVKDKCYLPGGVEVDYPPEQTAKDEDLWAVKAWCEIGGDGSFIKLRDQYPYACMWATPSLILRYLNTREASVMLSNFPNQELKSGDF